MKKKVQEKKLILFNVGGTYFQTSRSTLTRATPNCSPLHRISSNSTNINFDRDEKGAYWIDRDPAYFQVLLNYMRHGHLLLNNQLVEEGVLLEAEYFNIPQLVNLIQQRINNRALNAFLGPQSQEWLSQCVNKNLLDV